MKEVIQFKQLFIILGSLAAGQTELLFLTALWSPQDNRSGLFPLETGKRRLQGLLQRLS